MRRFIVVLVLVLSAAVNFSAHAAEAKLKKVLPTFLDRFGQHSVSPSLFERDAYQARLRRNPAERSGLRFDVQVKKLLTGDLKLMIELRGSQAGQNTQTTLENAALHRGGWNRLTLTGDAYQKFGELKAWRATLWDGGKLLSEQKSFLW